GYLSCSAPWSASIRFFGRTLCKAWWRAGTLKRRSVSISAVRLLGLLPTFPSQKAKASRLEKFLWPLTIARARAAVVQAEGAVAQAEARMRQLRELTRPSAEEALKQAQATLLNAQPAYDRA